MTERKYTLKYDMSDGQTNLTAGTFSIWDGDDGITFTGDGQIIMRWGTTIAHDNTVEYDYSVANPFDPTKLGDIILATGNYYRSGNAFMLTNSDSIEISPHTYVGKDGDDASGKNGTYITAIRVEAA